MLAFDYIENSDGKGGNYMINSSIGTVKINTATDKNSESFSFDCKKCTKVIITIPNDEILVEVEEPNNDSKVKTHYSRFTPNEYRTVEIEKPFEEKQSNIQDLAFNWAES